VRVIYKKAPERKIVPVPHVLSLGVTKSATQVSLLGGGARNWGKTCPTLRDPVGDLEHKIHPIGHQNRIGIFLLYSIGKLHFFCKF
jgi:hypothetical protein